ncbi:2-amino-4-hydroxy-6-hydroxymethyldihydropteridine diphosphokinase [Agromyces seonyuensis]|uniref:2-amino-4-hydroxy-6-hydroxymethyldihydropteridine diphosphokinase n=1 Tax=Agromyces seonyuensis TaxID=2662446 RepID=A0A6I4P2V1_9MICO|nr:2-amino-4-hydroxy-6-hydroxymethyldihydropteridine diphosphokinase [Agromyces seonyuensis]MWB99095.1 2-amino-4-hydroxy-6-hydroxymethyldihydropteridine diphosphokinase [Agromyces seonyuensis]
MTPDAAGGARAERLAVIAYGSNLGDRAALLDAAVADLGAAAGVRLVDESPRYETPAQKLTGVDEGAPRYLNGVVRVATTLDPLDLLDVLQAIEAAHGRVRVERWGDRTLDLDLIDVEGLDHEDARLTLPHPRAAERAFVLQPWLDLDPAAVLDGRSVAELRAAAADVVVRADATGSPS